MLAKKRSPIVARSTYIVHDLATIRVGQSAQTPPIGPVCQIAKCEVNSKDWVIEEIEEPYKEALSFAGTLAFDTVAEAYAVVTACVHVALATKRVK